MEDNFFTILWWSFAIHQHESAIGIYMCPPKSWTPHPIPLGCPRAWALNALLQASGLHWPSVLHMVIPMSQCYLRSSCPHLRPLSPKFWSLNLCLLCLANIYWVPTLCRTLANSCSYINEQNAAHPFPLCLLSLYSSLLLYGSNQLPSLLSFFVILCVSVSLHKHLLFILTWMSLVELLFFLMPQIPHFHPVPLHYFR